MKMFVSALVGAAASMSAASAQDEPSPFAEPRVEYLGQFAEPHKKVFVLERYDASGKLVARDVDEISSPIEIIDATHRPHVVPVQDGHLQSGADVGLQGRRER